MELASYLMIVLRPWYACKLLSEIQKKTTARYEVLIWMNCVSVEFDEHVERLKLEGCPIKVVGRSPENIGMAAFRNLAEAASGDLLIQLDDDVIMFSRRAIELARDVFLKRPDVGLLVGSMWQDEYTSGGHAKPADYKLIDRENLLYDGTIDGAFTFYRKEAVKTLLRSSFRLYWGMGAETIYNLKSEGMSGHLFRRVKMFHLHGPVYHKYFGWLDFEIEKLKRVGCPGIADVYKNHSNFPSKEVLDENLRKIEAHFECFDGASEVA